MGQCQRAAFVFAALLAAGCGPGSSDTAAGAWAPDPLLDETSARGCAASEFDRHLVLLVEDAEAYARLVLDIDHQVVPGQAISGTYSIGAGMTAHIDLGPGWPELCGDGAPATGPVGDSYIGVFGTVHVDLRPDLLDITMLRGTATATELEFDGPEDADAFVIPSLDLQTVTVFAE